MFYYVAFISLLPQVLKCWNVCWKMMKGGFQIVKGSGESEKNEDVENWRLTMMVNSLGMKQIYMSYNLVKREHTLGIQSPSENGNGTQILCWGCDWTSQSSAENMTGCLGNEAFIIPSWTKFRITWFMVHVRVLFHVAHVFAWQQPISNMVIYHQTLQVPKWRYENLYQLYVRLMCKEKPTPKIAVHGSVPPF